MTQRVATPAGEPHDAEVDECGNCRGRRVIRLRRPGGKWRHDDGTITCPPPSEAERTFDEVLTGERL
jgi:hypothetical protein